MANGLTVLYDACVFYPNHLRDILMQLSTTGLFAAKWTEPIHDEWMRNLRLNRPDIDTDKLETLKQRKTEEHTSELQSLTNLVCRLLLEKKKKKNKK